MLDSTVKFIRCQAQLRPNLIMKIQHKIWLYATIRSIRLVTWPIMASLIGQIPVQSQILGWNFGSWSRTRPLQKWCRKKSRWLQVHWKVFLTWKTKTPDDWSINQNIKMFLFLIHILCAIHFTKHQFFLRSCQKVLFCGHSFILACNKHKH